MVFCTVNYFHLYGHGLQASWVLLSGHVSSVVGLPRTSMLVLRGDSDSPCEVEIQSSPMAIKTLGLCPAGYLMHLPSCIV